MDKNGKRADISIIPFDSIPTMVIQIVNENNKNVNINIPLDTKVIYTDENKEEHEGIIINPESIQVGDIVLGVPLNSLIRIKDSGIHGRTVLVDNNLDIVYDAKDFQVMYSFIVGSGFAMYGINEKIEAIGGLNVRIYRISGFIDGLAFNSIKSMDILLETGDSLRRIDTIVLRKDQVNRTVIIDVKKGEPSTGTPSAPLLTQDFLGVYELPICDVQIDSNQTEITQLLITDRRENYAFNSNRIGDHKYAYDIADHQGWFFEDGRSFLSSQYPFAYSHFVKLGLVPVNQTSFKIPDNRGRFLRGVDSNAILDKDCNSRKAMHTGYPMPKNKLATKQNDAIRNITGTMSRFIWEYGVFEYSYGAIYGCSPSNRNNSWSMGVSPYSAYSGFGIDASRVVPTGSDNRPHNTAIGSFIFLGQAQVN